MPILSVSCSDEIYKEIKEKGLSPSKIFRIGFEFLKNNNFKQLEELKKGDKYGEEEK
ncbi:MAG: hypothetical protein QXG18_02735 [Candidatus Pacearchaeota archaeon]